MLKLERRNEASQLWRYGSPLLALLITVALGIGLFVLLGKDPVRGLQMIFWEPLKSAYALGELMVKATPPAATAPMTNCPSAPMFQTLERKQTAKPKAMINKGVAFTISSPKA